MRNMKLVLLSMLVGITTLVLGAANVSAQPVRTGRVNATPGAQQPLLSEYKGIRLGMTSAEVRSKLGAPALKADDQDYYIISGSETAQFAYDAMHKVVTISIDYMGADAPDYRKVVAGDIEVRADGSLYKLVRYDAERFWVSYSRTAGPVIIVTVTIQKM